MKLGIIGGSGLNRLNGMTGIRVENVETVYGSPSSELQLPRRGFIYFSFLPPRWP